MYIVGVFTGQRMKIARHRHSHTALLPDILLLLLIQPDTYIGGV